MGSRKKTTETQSAESIIETWRHRASAYTDLSLFPNSHDVW